MKLSRIRRNGAVWLAALALALPALILPPPVAASSHREAPLITEDPVADNTDVYFFRDPVDPTRLVLIANWIPFEEPAGGPNYFHFAEGVRYEFNIDNGGDGVEDITYRVTFTRNVRRGDTFLYNDGALGEGSQSALTDPNLIVFYTYAVDKIIGPTGGAATGAGITRIGNGLIEAPHNVGVKSYPDGYGKGSGIIDAIYTIDGDVRVFAGPRADPFFADLGAIFDLINFPRANPAPSPTGLLSPAAHIATNTLAGFNTQTIALSVPIQTLTRNGTIPTMISDANAIVGMWSSTWRQRDRVLSSTGAKPTATGPWVQVSRLGVPLVNEVVIPRGMKDLFNASQPKDDAQFAAAVLDPEVPKLLNALFGVNSPPAPRTDLVAVVLGIEGLTRRPGEVISDQLRLNVAVFPTPPSLVNRLGVIGGDLAGFPNGRRPYDDVVDIELRILAGVLAGPAFNVAPNNALGDQVDGPDRPFIGGFPFLFTPHSGWNHAHDNAPAYTRFSAGPSTD